MQSGQTEVEREVCVSSTKRLLHILDAVFLDAPRLPASSRVYSPFRVMLLFNRSVFNALSGLSIVCWECWLVYEPADVGGFCATDF